MKKALVLAFALASLGCKKSASDVGSALQDARSGDTAPARYAHDLQSDMKKASDAKDRANQAITQASQAVDSALKESGE